MSLLHISDVPVGGDSPLLLIAGPCQVEGRDHALMCAERLSAMAREAGMGFVYKSSYDKANRTSASAARGVGMDEGLRIFEAVKDAFGCPVLSDVHLPEQCAPAAEVIDVLQIPAFLCRQTDLLLAAAATGAAINVKKGQFLAPWDMKHVAAKITGAGNDRVLLTERGSIDDQASSQEPCGNDTRTISIPCPRLPLSVQLAPGGRQSLLLKRSC